MEQIQFNIEDIDSSSKCDIRETENPYSKEYNDNYFKDKSINFINKSVSKHELDIRININKNLKSEIEINKSENKNLIKCTNPLQKVCFPVPKFPILLCNIYDYIEQLENNIKEINDILNFSKQVEFPHLESGLDSCSICLARQTKYKQLLKQKAKNYKRIKNAYCFKEGHSSKSALNNRYLERSNSKSSFDDFSLRSSRESINSLSDSDEDIFHPRSF